MEEWWKVTGLKRLHYKTRGEMSSTRTTRTASTRQSARRPVCIASQKPFSIAETESFEMAPSVEGFKNINLGRFEDGVL